MSKKEAKPFLWEVPIKPKVKEGWVLPAHLHQNNPDCHNDECILVREVKRDI